MNRSVKTMSFSAVFSALLIVQVVNRLRSERRPSSADGTRSRAWFIAHVGPMWMAAARKNR